MSLLHPQRHQAANEASSASGSETSGSPVVDHSWSWRYGDNLDDRADVTDLLDEPVVDYIMSDELEADLREASPADDSAGPS